MEPEELVITDEESDEDRSPYRLFASIALLVIVIILILLFWRSCGAERAGDPEFSGGTIEVVDGLDSSDQAISVWVRPGVSITEVLARNDLSSAPVANMGEGTYVIDIGDRDPEQVLESLADDSGLYDVGYVFEEE